MEREIGRQKPRRKLKKAQLVNILEQNVALYKDDRNFVPHLVELTLYLLENEYDWAESGGAPPRGQAITPTPELQTPTPGGDGLPVPPPVPKPIPVATPPPRPARSASPTPAAPARPASSNGNAKNNDNDAPARKVVAARMPTAHGMERRICPFCGTPVADRVICPSCRNMTR